MDRSSTSSISAMTFMTKVTGSSYTMNFTCPYMHKSKQVRSLEFRWPCEWSTSGNPAITIHPIEILSYIVAKMNSHSVKENQEVFPNSDRNVRYYMRQDCLLKIAIGNFGQGVEVVGKGQLKYHRQYQP